MGEKYPSPIAILGHRGFVGSHLTAYFLQKKTSFSVYEGDVSDTQHLTDFLKQQKIGTVIDLIGTYSTVFSTVLEKNVETTQSIVEAMRQSAVRHLVYTSTGAIYGEPVTELSKESDTPHPNTLYGLSKFFAEQIVTMYSNSYTFHTSILRFPNIYGPQSKGGVIHQMIESVRNSGKIFIHGDGQQRRQFLHVEDVVRAIECVCTSSSPGVFNITHPQVYSLLDIANFFVRYYSCTVVHDASDNDLRALVMDSQKSSQHLNFIAAHDLPSYIEMTSLQ